jgi:hypothetical protein
MAKPEPGQKKVETIWLDAEISTNGEPKTKLFRCPNCGLPIVEYTGEIVRIIPGLHLYNPSIIIKCKGSVPVNIKYKEYFIVKSLQEKGIMQKEDLSQLSKQAATYSSDEDIDRWEECGCYYSFVASVYTENSQST